jgi:hypothetical protein
MHAPAAMALVSLLASCSPAARPVINEVLYDASGDDTNREFVELFNLGPAVAALAGLRLEAGDGAGAGRWTLRWTGTARDSIAGGARFVIGGSLVIPAPDAIATLDLQNGPDAVRLVWPDGATEVLGYGTPLAAEYSCGAPAADAPGGFSLARTPDGADLGSNAADFVPAAPTPGAPNQVRVDVACVRGALAIDPPQPSPGAAARLTCTIENRGTGAIPAGAATLVVAEAGVPLGTTPAPSLEPGESAHVVADVPGLAAGRHVLAARAWLAGDERASDDVDTLAIRVGPGPLEITEIQFHPASGEGEWVEVRAREPHVSLAAFTFADRTAAPATLPATAPGIEQDAYALLCQDRAALLAHFGALDAARVVQVSPWPSLNNSNDDAGIADAVVLREADGVPCDRVEYSARGVPAGEPIERSILGWGADSDPAGTPLASPRELPPLAGRFSLAPRRLLAGQAATLEWMLPWPRARLSIEVFDLAGRRVAREAGRLVAARGQGALPPLPGPGVYLVALQATAESGAGVVRESRVLRLEAGRR